MHAARVAPEKTVFSARPAVVLFPAERKEKRMAKLSYAEQLKHPNWQRKRLERLQLADWECENCGASSNTLHVHHRRYVKGRMAWEYDNEELEVLCEGCHESEHSARSVLDELLASSASRPTDIAVGLLAGYLACDCAIDDDTESRAKAGREPFFDLGVVAYAMEMYGVDAWRKFVRQVAASRSITPGMVNVIDQWGDAPTEAE